MSEREIRSRQAQRQARWIDTGATWDAFADAVQRLAATFGKTFGDWLSLP